MSNTAVTKPSKRSVCRRCAAALCIACACAVACKWTVRDRYPVLSTLFYATPWAVISLVLLIGCVLWWRAAARRAALLTLVASGVALGFTWKTTVGGGDHTTTSVASTAPAGQTGTDSEAGKTRVRVMQWNVARGQYLTSNSAAVIGACQADIVGLSEVEELIDSQPDYWRDFPDRQVSPVPVLRLDHVWVSSHIEVLRCEARSSWSSDHRAVVADLVLH